MHYANFAQLNQLHSRQSFGGPPLRQVFTPKTQNSITDTHITRTPAGQPAGSGYMCYKGRETRFMNVRAEGSTADLINPCYKPHEQVPIMWPGTWPLA
jgi:hypothetical protein